MNNPPPKVLVGAAADAWGLAAALGIPLTAAVAIALLAPVLAGGSPRMRVEVAAAG